MAWNSPLSHRTTSITALAVTLPGTRVIAGTATGPVHLLELRAYEQPLRT